MDSFPLALSPCMRHQGENAWFKAAVKHSSGKLSGGEYTFLHFLSIVEVVTHHHSLQSSWHGFRRQGRSSHSGWSGHDWTGFQQEKKCQVSDLVCSSLSVFLFTDINTPQLKQVSSLSQTRDSKSSYHLIH